MYVGTWVTEIDAAILKTLKKSGFELPRTPIAHNLPIAATPEHVGRRLRELEKAGFVDRIDDRGYYGLSDLGADAVSGELSPEEINNRLERD